MAQMDRNVNLEEIDSDALFGIDALKNQTILQKIVFFGSVIVGVLLNVLLPLYFETSRIVCVFCFLSLLFLGVLVGCNYTEDMTYGKYLYYFFFHPSTKVFFESTEDVEKVRKSVEALKKEEDLMLRKKEMEDPKAQKRLLVKVVVFSLIFSLFLGGIFLYGINRDEGKIHHQVETIWEG